MVGTETPKKTKTFLFAGKNNIINKHDAGTTNVKISLDHVPCFSSLFRQH